MMYRLDEVLAEILLWLGIGLILAETIVPGLIVAFLGLAALLMALALKAGFVAGLTSTLTGWLILASLLIIIVRPLVARWIPASLKIEPIDEDAQAVDALVTVVRRLERHDTSGRIAYRDSTWSAICPEETLEVGRQARLVRREGQSWVVRPDSPTPP